MTSKLKIPDFYSMKYQRKTYIMLDLEHLSKVRDQLNPESDIYKLIDVYY